MCGRYAATKDADQLVEEFEVDRVEGVDQDREDYNVAPTKVVPVIVDRFGSSRAAEAGATSEPTGGDAPVADEGVHRWLRMMRWGLVPSWAKDPKIGSRLINARSEQAAGKPAFRAGMRRRRCVVPADGYYEWYRPPGTDASGKPLPKQPFYIHRSDGATLAMAGVFESWRDPSVPDPEDPAAWLRSTTVLTTAATPHLSGIHDRMPVVLEPGDVTRWLDPATQDPAEVADLLVPTADGVMTAFAVSTRVNNVRNNGPELVSPAHDADGVLPPVPPPAGAAP